MTSPRVFEVPAPRDQAFAFLEAVTAQPGHLDLVPGERHLEILKAICDDADVVGDRVSDAVIGAVAVEHAATVATFDRDFARFSSVAHVRPDAQ